MKKGKGLCLLLILLLAFSSTFSTISLNKSYKREKAMIQKMEETRSTAFSLFNNYVEIDEFRIKTLLDNIGFHLEDNLPHLVMFVPPFPCSVCLDTEMSSFLSFIQSEDIMCSVVGTIQRIKDLRAYSAQYSNVSYYTYPLESFIDDDISDEIIYFLFMDNQVQKVFVTSKSSFFPSKQFLERAVSIINGKEGNSLGVQSL